MANNIQDFSYSPSDGLNNKDSFPTNPGSEAEARNQFMTLFNQSKDFINQNVVKELNKYNSQTLEASGQAILPGGLIVKWGTFKGSGDVVFDKPFPNNCLIVLASPMVAHTSQPPYSTLSGVTGGWDKAKFTSVTYGYDVIGSNGDSIKNLSYKNTVASANFQGLSRWFAVGF